MRRVLFGSGRAVWHNPEAVDDEDGTYDAATRLPCESVSAPVARKFVQGTLQGWMLDGLTQSIELLASELVTNALLHARSDVELRLRRFDGRVRLEVSDASPAPPRRRDSYGAETVGGHGMLLVEELADDWGVERHRSGKIVWCELSI